MVGKASLLEALRDVVIHAERGAPYPNHPADSPVRKARDLYLKATGENIPHVGMQEASDAVKLENARQLIAEAEAKES